MYQRRYDKVYLMLRQETAGYGMGSRGPWGSCILEIKHGQGKLTVAVEGLRPLLCGQYAVYGLLAKAEECRGIACGSLEVNKQGHGQMVWAFDPEEMGGGYGLADLFGIAVTTETGQCLSVPLAAYTGEKRQWHHLFAPLTEEADLRAAETAVLEAPPPVEKQEITQTAALPPKTPAAETKGGAAEKPAQPDFSHHGNFRGLLQKFRQEMAELEEMGILTAEESARILGKKSVEAVREGKDCQEVPVELVKKPEPVEIKTKSQPQERVSWVEEDAAEPPEGMAKAPEQVAKAPEQTKVPEQQVTVEWDFFGNNRRMTPFGDGTPWICISLKELLYFGDISAQRQRDFFFLLSYHRYGHLILRQSQEGTLVGLPDSYDSRAKRRAEGLGFTEFRPLADRQDLGYWMGRLSR